MSGSRPGWVVFALAASAFWLSFFHRVAPAAIADDLQRSFGIGGAMLGALAATYYVIYTMMQVPTGVLNDTVGPRRVLAAGCLVAGIGSLLFAAADSVAGAIIGRALAGLGVSVAFVSMLPYFVHGYGLSAIEATQHTSLMLVCLALSQGVIGALSDRVGRRRPLIVSSALAYLACWVAWLAGAAELPRASYAVSAVMGLSVCGMTLSWACAKELNPSRYSGIAISLVNTSGFLAVGLLQPLVGWLIDRGAAGAAHTAANYMPGIMLLTTFAGIALAAAMFVQETHCRNIWVDRNPRGNS